MFGCLNDVVCMFNLLNLLIGVIAGKPSRDFIRPQGMPRGLKGLLHMLNAIVSPMKADLCFLF
jgi:hypothetical protein